MTDLAKAVAFARHCLKWTDVSTVDTGQGTIIYDGDSERSFNPASDLQKVLTLFLGERYFIQINRDRTGLFQWQVIVGQQGLGVPGASFNHAQAQDDDLLDAIFEACIEAARMDKRRFPEEPPYDAA